MVTLWQICNRVSEVIGNPLTILQRVLATFENSTYLPEGCQHPLILGHRVLITLQSNCQRVLDNLYRHLQDGCPINKERGNLFAIPLEKLLLLFKLLIFRFTCYKIQYNISSIEDGLGGRYRETKS